MIFSGWKLMLHPFKMERLLHKALKQLEKYIQLLNKKYWSCIHLSEAKVHLESDQKHMLWIKEKVLQNTPSQLVRMFLILWNYEIELTYLPGKKEPNGRNFIMYNSGRNNNRFNRTKISWRIILAIWKHIHQFSLVNYQKFYYHFLLPFHWCHFF